MTRMTKILILALLAIPSVLSGQTVKKAVPELEFAHFDHNKIEFLGDSSAFEKAFSKMDAALLTGSGNFRIMHIGGSHVQAGTLTRQLRNDLLSLGSKDGGRGMVFPFTAASVFDIVNNIDSRITCRGIRRKGRPLGNEQHRCAESCTCRQDFLSIHSDSSHHIRSSICLFLSTVYQFNITS